MQLQGKRVLITGASRGIGEAVAGRFVDAGATVALVARSKDALESLAGRLGGTAHAADLSDPAQVASLIERVEEEAGPVDILVNNAGNGLPGGFTAGRGSGQCRAEGKATCATPQTRRGHGDACRGAAQNH